MAYQSINPNDGKLLQRFEQLSNSELNDALAAAERCFQGWKHTSYAERAAIVTKAAALLHAHVDDFARLQTLEMGKLIDEARGEVKFSGDILAYYAKHSESFLAPATLHPERGEAHMESSPLGVLFCVEPWNFPYYQLARVAGPQLMAGNVLVVKHAGCVPQCAMAFEKLLLDAGAPVGAYTNLLISYEQSDRVIDDPRIKGVALTGSVEAGRRVAARAGQNLKKSTMELGGSDAFIVLDDADLDRVIPWAVWGRMYNVGQTCCAAKRFIVLEAVADEFLARFKAAFEALRPGDPLNEKTTFGPLSTEAALKQLLAQVDATVEGGATLLLGGKRIARPGWFMQPTILTDIAPDNPAFRDEFFGPVASFYRVKSHAASGDWPLKPALPFTPGHEAIGIVTALGTGVTAVKEGDRVGVPWLHSACGHCEFCLAAQEPVCAEAQFGGYTKNGGFAEYIVADPNYVAHIPAGLAARDAAPLICAGLTSYKGLKETEARPGQWVVVSGIGGLGHLGVQYAKAIGLQVCAVDIDERKLAHARRLGADAVVNATSGDAVAAVRKVTAGGAHGVLITAPSLPAFTQGIGMTRTHGTCVLVGIPPGEFPTPLFDVVAKCITIRGSFVGNRRDMAEALAFASEGKVKADIELQPLSAINAVFEGLAKGEVPSRVVLDFAR